MLFLKSKIDLKVLIKSVPEKLNLININRLTDDLVFSFHFIGK